MAVVDHAPDDIAHVVGLVGILRHDRVERLVAALGIVTARDKRRILDVVRRHVRDQFADRRERAVVVVGLEMAHARLLAVRIGAAQLLHRDFFVGGRLDHVGARDEHVRGVAHHHDKVGHRRRIHRAARARSHDRGNLRHDAGRQHVAQKNIGVAGERDDAFLDSRAAAVVEADYRASDFRRQVHHLADLLGEGARQAAAEDGEIVAEDADLAAVDSAVAGHDAIAGNFFLGHVEVGDSMRLELVELDERAAVEQKLDPLARGHAPLCALLLDAILAAGGLGLARELLNSFEIFFKTHLSARRRIRRQTKRRRRAPPGR